MIAFLLAQIGKLKAAIAAESSKVDNLIKSVPLSGTTNEYGIIASEIPSTAKVVCVDAGSRFTLQFIRQTTHCWEFAIVDIDASYEIKAVPNVSVSMTIYYI